MQTTNTRHRLASRRRAKSRHANFTHRGPCGQASPRDGEIVGDSCFLSLDSLYAPRMRELRSYVAALRARQATDRGSVGRVVDSKNTKFAARRLPMVGMLDWAQLNEHSGDWNCARSIRTAAPLLRISASRMPATPPIRHDPHGS